MPRPIGAGLHTRGARARAALLLASALALVAAAGIGMPRPAVTLAAADTTPPVLVAFDFSPRAVDVSSAPAAITFTAEIADETGGTGLPAQGNYAEFFAPGSKQSFFVHFDAAHRVSGTATSARYQYVHTLEAQAAAGSWTAVVWVFDVAGNSRSYTTAQLRSLGFPSAMSVTSSAADTSPPQLAALDFNPKSVDVSSSDQVITVTARLIDRPAGAGTWVQRSQPSTVLFKGPSGQYVDAIFDSARLYSGTPQDGQYRVAMTVPAFSEGGTWAIDSVLLIDALLNRENLSRSQVAALGFPTTFTVISANADTTPPRLAGFDFSPKVIDTSSGAQSITFTAHITDDLSGVRELGGVSQLNFHSPSGRELLGATFNTLASGARTDGVFRYTATVPAGSQQGTWALSRISLADEAGNSIELSEAQVAALGFPTTFINGSSAVSTPTASPTLASTPTRIPPPGATPTPSPSKSASSGATGSATPTGTSTASSTPSPVRTATTVSNVSPSATTAGARTLTRTTVAGRAVTASPTEDHGVAVAATDDDRAGPATVVMWAAIGVAFVAIAGFAAFAAGDRFRGHVEPGPPTGP